MAAATAIAAALITPPIAILLGFFVGLLAVWSMVRRRWSDMWGYSVVVAAIASAVLAVFVVSYLQTGLASDQALDLMLRFADPARLDRWGVIPQIIAVAWIRDNYLQWEQPFGRATLQEIADFLRLRFLWPFLTGPLIAVVVLRDVGRAERLVAADGAARRPDRPLWPSKLLGVSLPWCCCSRPLPWSPGARKVSPLLGSARFLFPCW